MNANLRLNRSFGLGGAAAGPPGMPMPTSAPDGRRRDGGGGGALNQRGPGVGGGGPGGGDGPQMVIMEGGTARYRLDFYGQIRTCSTT